MAHHKARQDEEEVDTQKTMVHLLESITCRKGNGLEQMVYEHGTGCHSTQPVKNKIVRCGISTARKRFRHVD